MIISGTVSYESSYYHEKPGEASKNIAFSGLINISDFLHLSLGRHIYHKKLFKDLHDSTPSAIDELAQHDLFRTVLDAAHPAHPLHLIRGFEHLVYTFLLCYLPDDEIQTIFAG